MIPHHVASEPGATPYRKCSSPPYTVGTTPPQEPHPLAPETNRAKYPRPLPTIRLSFTQLCSPIHSRQQRAISLPYEIGEVVVNG
jgi:hypothetical protein